MTGLIFDFPGQHAGLHETKDAVPSCFILFHAALFFLFVGSILHKRPCCARTVGWRPRPCCVSFLSFHQPGPWDIHHLVFALFSSLQSCYDFEPLSLSLPDRARSTTPGHNLLNCCEDLHSKRVVCGQKSVRVLTMGHIDIPIYISNGPVPYDDSLPDDTKASLILSISGLFYGLAILTVLLRMYTQLSIVRRVALHDHLVLLSSVSLLVPSKTDWSP